MFVTADREPLKLYSADEQREGMLPQGAVGVCAWLRGSALHCCVVCEVEEDCACTVVVNRPCTVAGRCCGAAAGVSEQSWQRWYEELLIVECRAHGPNSEECGCEPRFLSNTVSTSSRCRYDTGLHLSVYL